MSNYLKTTIILFCIYMCIYTLIDYYYFTQPIQWAFNLLLTIVFSLIVSKLITK